MKWSKRQLRGFSWNITFLTLLCVCTLRGSQQQNPSRGTIQGTVIRFGTTEPISDVQITIVNESASTGAARVNAAQPLFTAISDNAGRFVITDVPVGSVVVRAQLQGYFGPRIDGIYPSVSPVTATVTAEKTTEVQLPMIPGGSISGRILDPNGRALPDATVQAIRSSYQNGLVMLVAASRTTDDRGDFRLYRLPPGQYYLDVSPQRVNPAGSRVSSASGPREIPIRTLYPSAMDLNTAVPVEVRSGEETSGLEIRVRTAPGFTVSGMVTSALPPGPVIRCRTTSVGVEGTVRPSIAEIMLVPVDRVGYGDAVAYMTLKEDGKFEINNVIPGSYDLVARLPVNLGWGEQSPPGFSVGSLAFGRSRVTVRGGDANDINVVVHSGVDLKGIVTIDGKPTPAEVRIALEADDVATKSGVYSGVIGQIATYQPAIGADGSFAIPLVPEARYRLNVTLEAPQPLNPSPPCPPQTTRATQTGLTRLPQDAYIADIRQDGASVYDDGINIGRNIASPVEIALKTGAGSLEGTVFGANQKPAAGALIVLAPPTIRRQNPALYRTVRSDAQGHFSLNKLPPGPFKLFAFESVQPGAYRNIGFLEKIEERGTAVTVSSASRANITLGLIQDELR